MVDKLNNLPSS